MRDYQLEAVNGIQEDWKDHKSILLVAATGAGKTQIFCEVLDRNVVDNRRGLVLVHRKELVEQSRDRLIKYWPRWFGRAGVVMAARDECQCQMIFATVQTLSSPKRLKKVLSRGKIDYIVTDEAHHAEAQTYKQVYKALRDVNPELRHLGVTATPIRADGKGLRDTFEKVTNSYDIKYLVKRRFLVPPRWLAVQTGISLAEVKTIYRDGERDFSSRQLADVFETDNCFELVVKTHSEYAHDRQAVAFTTTVRGAYDLAEVFRNAGYTAQAADANTGKEDRQKILNDFRQGRLQVLCNVGLYTEGLDVPEVSCIHQVRPTQSDGLYIQMVGRALRTYPEKEDALILDYAPKETRRIVMLGDVLGEVRKDAYIKATTDDDTGEIIGGFTYDGDFHWLEGSPAEIITRQLNYLDDSSWRWYRAPDGWMSLGMGGKQINRTAVMSPPGEDGQMNLYAVWKKDGGYWQSRLFESGTFEELSTIAEDWADKWADTVLAEKAKRWHKNPPTDGQIGLAKKLRVYREGMNRGELSDVITHGLAMKIIGGRNV